MFDKAQYLFIQCPSFIPTLDDVHLCLWPMYFPSLSSSCPSSSHHSSHESLLSLHSPYFPLDNRCSPSSVPSSNIVLSSPSTSICLCLCLGLHSLPLFLCLHNLPMSLCFFKHSLSMCPCLYSLYLCQFLVNLCLQ